MLYFLFIVSFSPLLHAPVGKNWAGVIINGCMILNDTSVKSIYQNLCSNETQTKYLPFLWYFLTGIGQCFGPAQKQSFENQKSDHVRIIYGTFSK